MSTDALHDCREAAQVALVLDSIVDAYVGDDTNGEPFVELMAWSDRVSPAVMNVLSDWGLALDPDRTMTRGDPTQTAIVARPD
jgi:hypothetical protein